MDKREADKIITEYVPKLFGFAMKKLSDIDRAGELAAEITLQVYQTLLKQDNIVNIDGYIYKIAQNVFVHYVDGKNKYTAVEGMEYIPDEKDFTEEVMNNETFGLLRREITYLSNLQRKIIVLYYFHDKNVREIAQMLSLPENTVKWHLTCSRKELKTGMEKIRTTGNLGTEPIVLGNLGHNGSVVEKDTSYFLAKSLTQNIAYAAYHTPRTINEIAEELGVNPIFVADEVAVLEEYGFMDKLPGEKYRTNIHITEPNDKGYLLKESGYYHCNVILCDSEQKWRSFLPAANNKTLTLAKEYSDAQTQNNLLCQPEHMHKLIAYYGQISVVFLFTRVMEELLNMGVLKEPTDVQKKGLCTILFLGE